MKTVTFVMAAVAMVLAAISTIKSFEPPPRPEDLDGVITLAAGNAKHIDGLADGLDSVLETASRNLDHIENLNGSIGMLRRLVTAADARGDKKLAENMKRVWEAGKDNSEDLDALIEAHNRAVAYINEVLRPAIVSLQRGGDTRPAERGSPLTMYQPWEEDPDMVRAIRELGMDIEFQLQQDR